MTDRLAMLRAAVTFSMRVGRAPKRRDLRPPDRHQWEQVLGIELPPDKNVTSAFGSYSNYLEHAGLKPATRSDFADVESASIALALEFYPELEMVVAEANHFDGFLLNGERVEVKGSHLQVRFSPHSPPLLHFNFKTHYRSYHQTIDRLLCIGVGSQPDTHDLGFLALFEFPQHSLPLVTNKASVTVYASSIWGSGSSQYSPYLAKRLPLDLGELPRWLRPAKRDHPDFVGY